jgi:lysophospholipase L1-like esterase
MRLFSYVAAAGLLASPAAAQVTFTRYVAVGDSFLAGVVSNALVDAHQERSIPALLARQASVPTFVQPLVAQPGIPAELALVSLGATAVIGPKSTVPGSPRNGAAAAYNNLAIPNTSAMDIVTRTADSGGMHDLVLRGRGTALAQALALQPTLATVWVGNDEILAAVLRGRAVEGQTLTPAATFRAHFQEIIRALRAGGATVLAANVMDMTKLPFATSIPPYYTDPSTGEPVRVQGAKVALLGPNGPLPEGTLVTLVASSLIAQGVGVPASVGGRGTPLPDEVILDAAEQAQIRARIDDFNRAIADVCQTQGVPVVDTAAFYQSFVQNGRAIGGIVVNNQFLTGGFWSYDGVHPTELGYAILANEWITALDGTGATLTPVGLAPYLGVRPADITTPTSGYVPFVWTADAQGEVRAMYAPRP